MSRTRQHLAVSRGIGSIRSLSTTPSNRHMFLVYAPDKTDEGAFERRLSVRPKHLVRSTKMFENGFIRLAGAILTPESVETSSSERKMIGSVLIMEAESIGAVRKAIEEDIYYTSGVVSHSVPYLTHYTLILFCKWDPEKLLIKPFAPAHFP